MSTNDRASKILEKIDFAVHQCLTQQSAEFFEQQMQFA